MKRLLPLGLLLAVALLLQPGVALAAWISHGSSTGSATATSVVQAGAPTVTRSGTTAVISWPQGALANGLVATGYTVKRTAGATTTTVCTVVEPTRTCSDTSPAPGSATYVVLSRFNGWTGVASNPTAFVFDTDAPVTTLASNPPANGNGFVISAPTLTLTATDSTTSVASITFKVGSSAAVTVNSATTSFTVSAPGTTTVTYAATDVAGNVESTQTYTVKRDSTAPTTVTITDPVTGQSYKRNNGNGGWGRTCSSRGGVCATAVDSESPIAAMTFRLVSGSTCFNGSAFVSTAGAGTSCDVAMAFDAANSDWFGGVANNALPSNANLSLTVTATNQAGLSKASTATTFATN